MLPDGWKRQKISEIAKVTSGGTPSRDEPIYWNGAIPWVTTSEISQKEILKTEETITEIGLKNSAAKIFPKGTILMAMYGQGKTRGQIAKLQIPAATNQACAAIILNKDNDTNYVYYNLASRYEEIRNLSNDGSQKNLSSGLIKEIEITCPPLPEQKKIAELLKTWDEAIETVEKLIANAASQKKDAMQKLLNAKIRLNSYTEQWKLTSLNELARIKMGSSPPSSAYNSDGNGLPLIQGNADIKNGKTHPRLFTSMVTQTCQIGDIIFSVRAPVGEVAISEHKACLGRGVAGICAKNAKHQDFIFQSLELAEDNWMRISQGSTFQAIGGAELKNYKLMVPTNDEEFLEISKILKQMDNQINLLTKYKSTISKEKSALMQQLLTGKRRVKIEKEDMAA